MPIGSELAKAIYKKLAPFITSPKREEMVYQGLPDIMEYVRSAQPRRLYLGGSFPTSKPDPKDIDILSYFAEGKVPKSFNVEGWPKLPIRKKPVEIFERNPEGGLSREEIREMLQIGRTRYGPAYKWIRLLTPIAQAISALQSGETFEPVLRYLQGGGEI